MHVMPTLLMEDVSNVMCRYQTPTYVITLKFELRHFLKLLSMRERFSFIGS